jgi:hypothetical protein
VDVFTYRVCDLEAPSCSEATVTVTVTARDDSVTLDGALLAIVGDEDTVLQVALPPAATDPDQVGVAAVDWSSFRIATGPQSGTAEIRRVAPGAVPTLFYTPPPNWHGVDRVGIAVDDENLFSTAEAWAAITVRSINDVPVVTFTGPLPPTATGLEDEWISLGVADITDEDDGGGPVFATVSVVLDGFGLGIGTVRVLPRVGVDVSTLAAGRAVAVSAANLARLAEGLRAAEFRGDPDWSGRARVVFNITDAPDDADTAPISVIFGVDVHVGPVHDEIVPADDIVTFAEDTVAEVDVLANDRDVEGDIDQATLRVAALGPGVASASVELRGVGVRVRLVPVVDFFGPASLIYAINGLNATLRATVLPVPDASMVAVAGDLVVVEDTVTRITAGRIILTDPDDPQGDDIIVAVGGSDGATNAGAADLAGRLVVDPAFRARLTVINGTLDGSSSVASFAFSTTVDVASQVLGSGITFVPTAEFSGRGTVRIGVESVTGGVRCELHLRLYCTFFYP